MIIANGLHKILNLPPNVSLDLFRDVHFTVRKGEFVTLVGKSASGKTTLLGILLGYEKEAKGTVLIDSKDLRAMNETELNDFRLKNFGICYQDKSPIILPYSVKENIGQRLKFLKGESKEEDVLELLQSFHLLPVADIPVLSTTMLDLYRLMLAMAFAGHPPIIVIDEILDRFPVPERGELMAKILSIQKQHHITLLLVTHLLELMKQSDRGLYLKDQTLYFLDINRLKQYDT